MPPSRRVRGSGCTATEHVEIVKPISHPAWRGWDIALFSFCFQQLSFSVHSPPVPGQRSARSYDPMAGDHERHAIHGASPRHRSRGLGLTHLPCQFAVAARLSSWNLAQRLPNAQLKHCSPQIQRSLCPAHPRQVRTVAHHLQRCIHQPRERGIAPQFGGRELRAQIPLCLRSRLRQREPTKTAFCGADDHSTER